MLFHLKVLKTSALDNRLSTLAMKIRLYSSFVIACSPFYSYIRIIYPLRYQSFTLFRWRYPHIHVYTCKYCFVNQYCPITMIYITKL